VAQAAGLSDAIERSFARRYPSAYGFAKRYSHAWSLVRATHVPFAFACTGCLSPDAELETLDASFVAFRRAENMVNGHGLEIERTPGRIEVRASPALRGVDGARHGAAVGGLIAMALIIVTLPDLISEMANGPLRDAYVRPLFYMLMGGAVGVVLFVLRWRNPTTWCVDARAKHVRVFDAKDTVVAELPLSEVEDVVVGRRWSGGWGLTLGLRSGAAYSLGVAVTRRAEADSVALEVRELILGGRT